MQGHLHYNFCLSLFSLFMVHVSYLAIKNYFIGYVLDSLPAMSPNKVDIDEQLEFVKNLCATVIIHLRVRF